MISSRTARGAEVCLFVLILVCAVSCTSSMAVERGPVGLTALNRPDLLPYLFAGREARHTSSHDLDGGNDDRGNYLGVDGLTKVLFDAKGAGCIYRIWTTNQFSSSNFTPTAHGNIRIYIDGALIVNTTLADFFSGTWSIFQKPLTGNAGLSSGGFYSYVPIAYRSSCKIEWIATDSTTPALYFNIDYISYDSPDGVVSLTGNEDVSAVSGKWQNPGTDPKPVSSSRTFNGTVSIPKEGGKTVICDITGPGCINSIRLKTPEGNGTHSEWWNVIVRIYFDNHTSPDIQTNYGRFFGGDFFRPTDRDITGTLFGTNRTSGWNYNFFPMPFATRAKIELQNNDYWVPQSMEYEVKVADLPDAQRLFDSGQIGYFKSTQVMDQVASVSGVDYNMLDTAGRGQVVAYVYSPMSPDSSRGYLEGDERIHTDNSLTPAIYGTGTEDTFNGGWYFKYGEFCLPSHGFTAWRSNPEGRALYRIMTGDIIPYNSRVSFGFEVGPNNDINGVNTMAHMYSTVYYYQSPISSPLLLTDTLDVGTTTSETSHNYTVSASNNLGVFSRTARYEGDNDGVSSTDSGRHFANGYSTFRLTIRPDNFGIKLRRLSYYAVANQNADVYVDNQYVGPWYDAGVNSVLWWRDTDFTIPAQFTQGKSSINVKLHSVGEWTEYKYQVFTFVSPQVLPPAPTVNADGGYNPISHTLRFSWIKPNEPVWGIIAYKYAVGSTPGGTDLKDWSDASDSLLQTVQDITIEDGRSYYVSVKAKNGVGVWSQAGVSSELVVPKTKVADIKKLANGTSTSITGCVVSGVFNGFFYVEDTDRTVGIKIDSAEQVSEGDIVYIEGIVSTAAGERKIEATKVVKL